MPKPPRSKLGYAFAAHDLLIQGMDASRFISQTDHESLRKVADQFGSGRIPQIHDALNLLRNRDKERT